MKTASLASNESYKPIPRLTGFDLVSHTFHLFRDIRTTLKKTNETYGDVVMTGVGYYRNLLLFGPDWNQLVYVNKDGMFSSYEGWNWILERVFPGSVMAMDGDDHRYQRRIMAAAFKKPKLVAYLSAMNPKIKDGIDEWRPSDNFLVFPAVKNLTLDLATKVFMGVGPDYNSSKLNKSFIDTVEASIGAVRYPVPFTKMWHGVKGRAYLVKEFARMLPQKRAENTSDFFSQFCHAESEDGEKFTDQEIIDHMIFLMMAAHDTTTSTLTTMFYLLGKHPEWQERLRQASMNLGKEDVDYDDLEALQEIEWVMKEALRLYPPLPTMPRVATRDIYHNGYRIKKGTMVSVSPIHTHYMPSLWSNPEAFDPERFSPGRDEQKSHQYAWIPFGGGAHMCLGQHFADIQVKSVLHKILLNYKWEIPSDYVMPYQLMPIAKPKDGLPIRLMSLN